MIEKPKQYYDTMCHQLYYQWSESEYFTHQEPIYDRTKGYIESLEAENAKLRELVSWMYDRMDESCAAQYPYAPTPISYDRLMQALAQARELGVEVTDG